MRRQFIIEQQDFKTTRFQQRFQQQQFLKQWIF